MSTLHGEEINKLDYNDKKAISKQCTINKFSILGIRFFLYQIISFILLFVC